MRTIVFASIIFCLLAVPSISAEGLNLEISPFFGYAGGTHSYEIEFLYKELIGNDTVIAKGRSKLEFPDDGLRAGVRVGLNTNFDTSATWLLEAYGAVNVSQPKGEMIDSDWKAIPFTAPEEKWSYSESSADGTFLELGCEAGFRMVRKPSMSLALIGSVQYRRIEQDLIGLAGWQIREGTEYTFDMTGTVGYYKVTHLTFAGGLRGHWLLGEKADLMLKGLAGRVMIEDFDDHLLRGKTMKSSPTGYAGAGSCRLRFVLDDKARVKTSVSLVADINYLKASGSQTQEWYMDEEDTPAGTIVTGIPVELEYFGYFVGVQIGLAW